VDDSDAFADFWSKLASKYKENQKVFFGLMNEPHDMDSAVWFKLAQAAINAIRDTKAANMIFVPGNCWTGAHRYMT
jgi:endoglucanase